MLNSVIAQDKHIHTHLHTSLTEFKTSICPSEINYHILATVWFWFDTKFNEKINRQSRVNSKRKLKNTVIRLLNK